MQNIRLLLIIFSVLLVLTSCKQYRIKKYETIEDFKQLEQEMHARFGKDAYYLNFSLINNDFGSIFTVTVTTNPSSKFLTQWTGMNRDWNETKDNPIPIPVMDDKKPEDFLIQPDFVNLGRIVEKAVEKVKLDKGLDKVKIGTITINASPQGYPEEVSYFITISPTDDSETYSFIYSQKGELEFFFYE